MKVEVTYRGALPELLGRSSETVEARTAEIADLESQLEERLKNTQWMNALVAEELTDEQLREREESARREALDALAAEEALLEEAEKRGLTLEQDAIRADADQRYEQMIAMVESYALSAYSSLEGEALAHQVDALLAASGASREQYRRVSISRPVYGATMPSTRGAPAGFSPRAFTSRPSVSHASPPPL